MICHIVLLIEAEVWEPCRALNRYRWPRALRNSTTSHWSLMEWAGSHVPVAFDAGVACEEDDLRPAFNIYATDAYHSIAVVAKGTPYKASSWPNYGSTRTLRTTTSRWLTISAHTIGGVFAALRLGNKVRAARDRRGPLYFPSGNLL
jgi:hypothetical protein